MTIRVSIGRYGPPAVLEASTVEPARPRRGEVRIRALYAGVNPHDLHVRSGLVPHTGDWPYVPGSEVLGLVEQVGPGVTRLRAGDSVLYLGTQHRKSDAGGYQQLPVVPAHRVARVPRTEARTPDLHLGLHTITAWLTLESLDLQPGMRALIHAGQSAVGRAAIRICALSGVHVVTTTSRPDRKDGLMRAGAAEVVDIGDPIWHRDLEPVDRVLELVGTATFERSLRLLKPGGALMLAGSSSGSRLDLDAFHLQGKTLSGFSSDVLAVGDIERAAAAVAERPELSEGHAVHRFDLSDAAAAHQALMNGTITGRTVLDCML